MARQVGRKRARRGVNSFTTHSGNTVKVKQSFAEKRKTRKDAKARRKAIALSTLPKNPFLRQVYRLHPKRLATYWFSRDGAIMALKIVGIAVVVCFVLLIGLFAYFRKDLPKINSLAGDKLGGSITYYDRTGKTVLWQDYDAVKRIPVKNDEISKYIKQATVAIEDQHFYTEGAFNMSGIARAALHDVFGMGSSDGLQGGSTITQQLVKLNEDWGNNRTIGRKIKELILAIDLNREYSKQDILAGYLNIAPYGGIEYGCESAARDYFHTSCKDLTLPQAAMLASIPQSPTYYSPYGSHKYNPATSVDTFNKQALLNRQRYTLDQMAKLGMISQEQANKAKKVDVLAQVHQLSPKFGGIKAPYFVLAAKQALEEKYGAATVKRGGWSVITTLDLSKQKLAEKLVQQNLPNVEANGGDEEAIVAEDVQTGQIVSMVGGTDFDNPDHGKINYAASALIPPGSSFKPYDYATLINDSNAGAGSVLYDTQEPILDKSIAGSPGYPCTNKQLPPPKGEGNCLWDYDFRYPGPLTLRYALAGSRNVPAVKAMIQAGVKNTISTATKMMNPNATSNLYNCYQDEALTKVGPCYPSAAIGDGAYLHLDDHVNGLGTLARLGKSIPKSYILKITDASGKTIDEWHQPKGEQVIKPDTAYIVDNMLSDPKASYLPAGYKFQNYNGWDFAVKTGTTNDNFDGLMTSWSTKYAVVSWVGYHTRNKALTAGAMEYLTEPLTRGFMEGAHAGLQPDNWKQPDGIQHLPAFVVRNHVGVGSIEPSPSTDIYPSWYKPKSGAGESVTIDKVSNKRATKCTPDLAKETVTNGNANQFSIDQFVNNGSSGINYDASASDDIHNCDDSPPTVQLSVTNTDGDTTDECDSDSGCTIAATVQAGTYALSSSDFPGKLTIKINGKTVKTAHVSKDGQEVDYSFTPTASGKVSITAEVVDSVLYSGSDSATVDAKVKQPTQPACDPKKDQDCDTTGNNDDDNNGNDNGGGNGNNTNKP